VRENQLKSIQRTLAEVFEQKHNQIAIEYSEKKISYRQLDVATRHIAKNLMCSMAKKGSHIGVLLKDKSISIAALIAIIRSRMVFVPLDTAYPSRRLSQMIDVADVSYLITDEDVCTDYGFELAPGNVIELSSRIFDMDIEQTENFQEETEFYDNDPIYLYFTSGTTGVPKAVVGKNISLSHFINWELETFQIDTNARVSQLTPISHDPFLRDVFVPLFAGGTICIPADKNIALSPPQLVDWLDSSKITLIHCTPSLLAAINELSLRTDQFADLKHVLLAGERLFTKQLTKWYGVFDDRIDIVNLYGPTETTLAKVYHVVQKQDLQSDVIPIGKPIMDTKIILLDAQSNICANGECGEICIDTPFSSLGYYCDGKVSQNIFKPLSDDLNVMIYRTGDMGRYLPDGALAFEGRNDDQYKIRGYRVNLNEIECTLLRHPAVERCAIKILDPDSGNGKMISYFVASCEVTDDEIREYVEDYLPEYMRPIKYIKMRTLPLTINGKTDYSALSFDDDESGKVSTLLQLEENGSGMMKELTELWRELLDRQDFSYDDTFMDIGGDSLSIMLLIARLDTEYCFELTLWQIFDGLTIRKLASLIEDFRK
jgi:amino acid adenylation domain-containing protein